MQGHNSWGVRDIQSANLPGRLSEARLVHKIGAITIKELALVQKGSNLRVAFPNSIFQKYDPIFDRFNTRIAALPAPPKNITDFWLKKLISNETRDSQVKSDLELLGWRVITVRECELREPGQLAARLDAGLTSDIPVFYH